MSGSSTNTFFFSVLSYVSGSPECSATLCSHCAQIRGSLNDAERRRVAVRKAVLTLNLSNVMIHSGGRMYDKH